MKHYCLDHESMLGKEPLNNIIHCIIIYTRNYIMHCGKFYTIYAFTHVLYVGVGVGVAICIYPHALTDFKLTVAPFIARAVIKSQRPCLAAQCMAV